MAATQRICAANGPEHAGALEAVADDGLAAGFDAPRTDEQMLLAKGGVSQAVGVACEVVCFSANRFG